MTPTQRQDIFEWDVVNWSRALDIWEPELQNASKSKALTLGERGGGLSLYLAQKGAKVTCTDLRDFPDSTKELHQRHQVASQINYRNEDITSLSFDDSSFDIVMFKSVIGALSSKEKQQKAIDEIYRVLKPGGVLLFAENGQASKLHQTARKRFVKWNSYWRYIDLEDDLDLFKRFKEKKLKTFGFLAAFGRNDKQRSILGKIDGLAQKLVTKRMRYIIAGVCKK